MSAELGSIYYNVSVGNLLPSISLFMKTLPVRLGSFLVLKKPNQSGLI